MEPGLVAYVAGCVLVYALSARVLGRLWLTAPIFFLVAGLPAGPFGLELLGGESLRSAYVLADLTLALVLFVDATHAAPAHIVRPRGAPLRLLLLGLPLVVALGTGLAMLLVPGLSFWEAAVLAAVVAPTDAALVQPMLEDERVPADVRHVLNVESGLNDGLSVPILLVLMCVARSGAHPDMTGYWVGFSAAQLTLGPAAGAAVGYVGTRVLLLSSRGQGDAGIPSRIGLVGVAVLSYGLAELVHGNGLIACFVSGLVTGRVARRPGLTWFADAEGKLLAGLVFFLVGAQLLPAAWDQVSLETAAFAVAVLTVGRMLPSVLTLVGTKLGARAILAIGWFGPRGVATVVFALLVVHAEDLARGDLVFAAAVTTVVLSIVLHGVTAAPAARWLSRPGF